MPNPCAVLIYDRKATAATGKVVIRPCGAPNTYTVKMKGDLLFSACSRHNNRLKRAGIRFDDHPDD